MAAKHNPFGPSSLDRRLRCPGSYAVEMASPEAPASDDASEGTFLHRCVAAGTTEGCTPEQAELVERCLAYQRKHLGETVSAEQTLRLYDEGYAVITEGTCDALSLIDEETVAIIDWKFGRNEVEEAAANVQLAAYAAMAMLIYNRPKCVAHVFQPRLNKASVCIYTDPEKIKASVKMAVAEAMRAEAPCVPGEAQCRYCRGSLCGTCPALTAKFDLTVKELSPLPTVETLPDEALGEYADALVMLEDFGKAVRGELRARIYNRGAVVAGYDLTKGRTTRSCADLQGLFNAVEGTVPLHTFLDCCSVSVGQVETAYCNGLKKAGTVKTLKDGKAAFAARVSDLIETKTSASILKKVTKEN